MSNFFTFNRNFNKKFFFTVLLLCNLICIQKIFATTAQHKENGYTIKIVYNDTICPGDPVFLVGQFIFSYNYFNVTDFVDVRKCISGKAELIDKENEKQVRMGNIFNIKSSRYNSCAFSILIPTSSYLQPKDYEIKVSFNSLFYFNLVF